MGPERTAAAVAGANMWALLQDNDPGHDASAATPPADNVVDEQAAKRSKKKTKKKKKSAGDETTKEAAAPPSNKEENEEAEINGASRCRAVARRVCRAAVVGALLALWCHLTSAPPVAAAHVV